MRNQPESAAAVPLREVAPHVERDAVVAEAGRHSEARFAARFAPIEIATAEPAVEAGPAVTALVPAETDVTVAGGEVMTEADEQRRAFLEQARADVWAARSGEAA